MGWSIDGVTLVSEKLSQLQRLENDWDSYGGSPPTAQALEAAERLIKHPALELDLAFAPAVPMPDEILPNPDGGIELEWNAHDQLFALEILPTGTLNLMVKRGKGSAAHYHQSKGVAQSEAVNELLAFHHSAT